MNTRCVALASLALLALGIGAAAWAIDAHGHAQSPTRSDAIVVLGTRVLPNGMPSLTLRERVSHAVELYRAGVAPNIICTGGVGENPPSEARAAATLAQKMGVPPERIAVEEKSTTTHENAVFAAQICRERGWKSVVVVSQPFHLWRGQREFHSAGIKASGSAVRDSAIDAVAWKRAWYALREVPAALRCLLF
jgi:uncharacterized SAM-binding protein YcdF (DUF218 family)